MTASTPDGGGPAPPPFPSQPRSSHRASPATGEGLRSRQAGVFGPAAEDRSHQSDHTSPSSRARRTASLRRFTASFR